MDFQGLINRIIPSKRAKQLRDLRIDISFYPVLITVLVIPASYSEVSSNYNKTDFISWIFIKIFAWTVASFYAGFFIKLAGIDQFKKINFAPFFGISFLTGALVATNEIILSNMFNLPEQVNPYLRLTLTGLLTFLLCLLTSILGTNRRNYKLVHKSYEKALYQSAFLDLQKDMSFKMDIANHESNIKKEILSLLRASDDHLSLSVMMDRVQNFSRYLTEYKIIDSRRKKFYAFLDQLRKELEFSYYNFRTKALSPSIFSFVISSIFGIVPLRNNFGLAPMILIITYFLITYYAQLVLTKLMKSSSPSIFFPIFVSFFNIAFILGVDNIFKLATPDVFHNANLFWVFVIYTIVYFAVCFAGHFAAGTSKYEEHLLLLAVTQPELSLSREKVLNKKKIYLNNQWANFLHNKIQSKLLVLGLSNNLTTFEHELSEIIEVVEKQSFILKSSHIIKSSSISESLEIIDKLWSNSIMLNIDLADGLLQHNFDLATLVDLEEVLRELIANAVRHGGANQVNIEIGHLENGRINIKSTNNGSPYKPKKIGLGTQFLNELSPNNWKIENKDGQVIVNLILVENRVIS
jgi:hypothetical protein